MKTSSILSLAVVLWISPRAGAAEVQPGPELGLRVGYATAVGHLYQDVSFDRRISGQVPFRLDARYRFGGRLAVGAFAQYGYPFVAGDWCSYNATCSGATYRLGLEATAHFPFGAAVVPWVGLGFGYEWWRITQSYLDTDHIDRVTASGPEFLSLEIGADYFARRDLALGPYLALSLAEDTHYAETNVGVKEAGVHGWVEVGVRGTFSLLSGSPVFAATAGVPYTAPPALADRSGFELGLRLGYAIPMNGAVSDAIRGQVPFRLDLLRRFGARYALGVYAQYGQPLLTERRCAGVDCSGSLWEVGVEGTRHFGPTRWFVPWVGVGFGYEWLQMTIYDTGNVYQANASGLQWLALQLGADHFTSPGFGLGPFVSLSVGRYDGADSAHEWVAFGLRGSFRL